MIAEIISLTVYYQVCHIHHHQKAFFEKTWSFCSWYSARVISMFLKEGRLAKILPPNQHIESRFAGASTRVLISLGSILLSSFTNLSGNPSSKVLPPLRTI